MSSEKLRQRVVWSNLFYERLIVIRDTNEKAFMRFSGATRASLRAYEEAKKKAEDGTQGRAGESEVGEYRAGLGEYFPTIHKIATALAGSFFDLQFC